MRRRVGQTLHLQAWLGLCRSPPASNDWRSASFASARGILLRDATPALAGMSPFSSVRLGFCAGQVACAFAKVPQLVKGSVSPRDCARVCEEQVLLTPSPRGQTCTGERQQGSGGAQPHSKSTGVQNMHGA